MNSNEKRPFTEYLSPEARERLARSRDEVLKEHWGPDRFEAYRARFKPPAWLAAIQCSDSNGSNSTEGFV